MTTATHTVVGVFDDQATAQRVVEELVSSGLLRENISLTSGDRFAMDTARGSAGLSGYDPADASGGGIGGFFRRLFGADVDEEHTGHYAEALRHGATVVSVTTDGANNDRTCDIMERHGALDVDSRAGSWRDESLHSADTDARSIPVVREDMHVGKREVQRGGVRIYSRMHEEPVEEKVSLREEHVRVDRRKVDRPATEADFRQQDDVIEVTEMAEEPVVGKTMRVVEEVVIDKDARERTETVRGNVRRSEVHVEKLSGSDDYDDDFRNDFKARYGSLTGARWESYQPAYQYGYRMASDDRYSGRNWDEIEPTLRTDYERQYPHSTWDQIKDSVRYGWDRMTGRR